MAHRTTGGKDVTTVLIEHGCQLHATSNHATCQSRFATKRELQPSSRREEVRHRSPLHTPADQAAPIFASEVPKNVSSASGFPPKLAAVLFELAFPRFVEKPIKLIQRRLQGGHVGRSRRRTLTLDDLIADLLQRPHVGLLR